MSKTAVVFRDTNVKYTLWLHEENQNHKAVEERIIGQLIQFSESNFSDSKWVQRIEKQRHPREAHFGAFAEFESSWVKLAKLWVILESTRIGRLCIVGNFLANFFVFMASKRLNPKNIARDTFRMYQDYLDNSVNKQTKEPLQERSKYSYYTVALDFVRVLQGHSEVAIIKNIEAMVNPYEIRDYGSKNRQIPQSKLDITDEYFLNSAVPLHFRICYWLIRLYGIRPDDVCSFPLDCVKELKKDEIGTLKMWVGKQGGARDRIDSEEERPYKTVLLNLREPKQKMLFEMINKQQAIAKKLQKQAIEKNFLLTCQSFYVFDEERVVVMKAKNIETYWERKIKPLFEKGQHPRVKAYKHTAISKRATWGTHTFDALRDVANHQSFGAIDNYIKPAKEDQVQLQRKILEFERNANLDLSFKGEVVYDMKYIMPKIMENPYAHQLPGYGFCPDASKCGDHFHCIGCDFLVPSPKLRDYYYAQAEEYAGRADNLAEIGKNHLADDRMTVALKFYRLYNRTFNDELKALEDVEMINLEEVNLGEKF